MAGSLFADVLLGFAWPLGQGRASVPFHALAGATGMILTKETYVLHIGSFLLAGTVLSVVQKVLPRNRRCQFRRNTGHGATSLMVRHSLPSR